MGFLHQSLRQLGFVKKKSVMLPTKFGEEMATRRVKWGVLQGVEWGLGVGVLLVYFSPLLDYEEKLNRN